MGAPGASLLGTWESTNLDPSGAGFPANFHPAPFFWRGPAEGSWPHRRWQVLADNYTHPAHNGKWGGDCAGLKTQPKSPSTPTPLFILTAFCLPNLT
jgi:hypothetical protein